MIVQNERDVDRLNFSKLSKNLTKVFPNSDADDLIRHVSECLIAGNSVALQAAGSNSIIVHVGKGLF